MKRKLSLLLIIALVSSLLPVVSFAADYEGDKIVVSGMTYSASTLTKGSELDVSASIEKLHEDGSSQDYIFATVVKLNGKTVSRDIKSGTLYDGDKIPLKNTVEIPNEDLTGIKVESYFWDSLENGIAIAPMATFKTSDNKLRAVYIDGVKLEGFGGNDTEASYLLPASCMHLPEIKVIPSDNSAEVRISAIKSLPGDIKIRIVPGSGSTKTYTLKLDIAAGTVSNAYMINSSMEKKAIGVDTIEQPVFSGLKPGDDGFDWETMQPTDKTLVYNDRIMYYYEWPPEFDDAVAVQTSLQLIRYDDAYKKADNKDATMGEFTIDRSADIYLFANALPAWAQKDGYVRDSNTSNVKKVKLYYTGQGTKNPIQYSSYKKTVTVPEGETRNIRIGSAVTSSNSNATDYWMIVDFISPTEVYSINNVEVPGAYDFEFDEEKTEYEIELDEDTTEIPEITYDIVGIGTTVTVNKATSFPGTTTLTVKSLAGATKTYKFNFKKFENKLTDLKINGTSIYEEGVFEYTYNLKYGWKPADGFPTVTPTASSAITVDIVEATEDTMETVITLTAEKAQPKTYKITFVETLVRPLKEVKTALGWNQGAIANSNKNIISVAEQNATADTDGDGSKEQINTGKLATYKDNNTSYNVNIFGDHGMIKAFNKNGAYSGNYYTSLSLMQLNLSKLVNSDVDLTKPVVLRLYSSLYDYDQAVADANVYLYDVSDVADWDTLADKLDTVKADTSSYDTTEANYIRDELRNVNKYTDGKTPVAAVNYNASVSALSNHDYDITEFVKNCIEEGNLTPTLAVVVENKAPTVAGKSRSRLVFKAGFSNSSNMSYLVYYVPDEE